jgi:hypothetical protein
LTESQRSELVERYEAGESVKALAVDFGIDRRTAMRIIRSVGSEVRYRADVDVDAARVLYETGFSLARVGEELNVSARTVLNLFRRAGIPTRPVGSNQWTRETLVRIRDESAAFYGVEPPGAVDALQFVFAAVVEAQA